MRNISKTDLVLLTLIEISQDELATRHVAAVRATFEPEWEILEADYGEALLEQQPQQKQPQQQQLQKQQETQKIKMQKNLFHS